jgi:hypothetical protein
MEQLATALASYDLGTMIDVLLNDVNDEFITLAALGETQRSLERAGARLTLLKAMGDHYAAMADKAADDRFNASLEPFISWEGNQ